jgi:hypothetical protein
VNGTGSESCPVVGFGINGVEPSGSSIRVLVGYMQVAYELQNNNDACSGDIVQRLSDLYRSITPTQDAARFERSTVQLSAARRYNSCTPQTLASVTTMSRPTKTRTQWISRTKQPKR